MILRCTFEELAALNAGAQRALAVMAEGGARVAAPPEVSADVEALVPRLDGDLSITTYEEAEGLEGALDFILAQLKDRMDTTILEEHVGSEATILAYFDYAHVLTVRDRLHRMRREMEAMIELMSGRPPTPETARRITFPD